MGVPQKWDDDRYLALSRLAKLLFDYLCEGPPSVGSVPGLVKGGPASFADSMREPEDEVRAALGELVASGLAVYDARVRLVQIPNRPKYDRPSNGLVVKSWFGRWQKLPNSPLKLAHVEALRPYCERHPMWAETFGSVEHGVEHPIRHESDTLLDTLSNKGQDKASLDGSGSGSGSGSSSGSGIATVVPASEAPPPVAAVALLPELEAGQGSPGSPTERELARYRRGVIARVIARLNENSGHAYEPNAKQTERVLLALLKRRPPVTEAALRAVVWHRCAAWRDDPKMAEYLRPETLFGAKFDSYLAQAKKAWGGPLPEFDADGNEITATEHGPDPPGPVRVDEHERRNWRDVRAQGLSLFDGLRKAGTE